MTRRRQAWTPENLGLPDEAAVRVAVGRQLKRYRIVANLATDWLAKRLGIEEFEYLQYESGEASLPIERAFLVAQLVGVEVQDLTAEAPAPSTKRSLRNYIALAREIDNLQPEVKRLVGNLVRTLRSDKSGG